MIIDYDDFLDFTVAGELVAEVTLLGPDAETKYTKNVGRLGDLVEKCDTSAVCGGAESPS